MEPTEARTAPPVSGRVRDLLRERGLSDSAMARELGFSQPYMSRRMRGDVPWRVDELTQIATFLNVPVTELLATAQPATTAVGER